MMDLVKIPDAAIAKLGLEVGRGIIYDDLEGDRNTFSDSGHGSIGQTIIDIIDVF